MDGHTLEVLGFQRVRELLAGCCQTELGRESARSLVPADMPDAVTRGLDRLAEVLALSEEPPLAGIGDLRETLGLLGIGAVLTGQQLLGVFGTCVGLRLCAAFLGRHRDVLQRVRPDIGDIRAFPDIEQSLGKTLDESGAVRDDASAELARTRRQLRKQRNALIERLERLAAAHPDWYSGPVTVKSGRLVLPLGLENRNRLPGVIHGSSGSGQTLYVEPIDAVTDGNELQELRDAEAEEVARILRECSRLVAGHGEALARAQEAVARLDLMAAKRRLAIRFDCRRPELSQDGRIEIVRGRHLLLAERGVAVVPLDLTVPEGVSVVLISGPNAGGKTVVLKTLGLFSLMMRCGMYLPAGEGTRLPVFRQVYADIGDEQSLESDLSSFTAHLRRLGEIVAGADKNSLVLIDEIGASTAPEEGAALAVAVLEHLRDRRVCAVATTHFGALKAFVQGEPGMSNAAMEWGRRAGDKRGESQDEKQEASTGWGPTYRLRMGVPGESSALEIAAAAGFPQELLSRAKARIGTEWLDLAAKLRSIDDELARTREARRQAEAGKQEAARLRERLEEKMRVSLERVQTEEARSRVERERFVKEKRREIENLVRELRERGADKESVVAAKSAVERELREVAGEEAMTPAAPEGTPAVGDVVESLTFRRTGEVVAVATDGVTVAFGHIRMRLAPGDLVRVQSGARNQDADSAPVEPLRFDPRVDVRGLTRDEAWESVQRLLEEATVNGARELSILHGKGTGALRRMLWDALRRDPRVEAVRLAEESAGGSGVTLVAMRVQA